MNLLSQCIRFREMLLAFIRREIRQRYVGSILGRPWPFLQPLIMLGVYYFVFREILDVRLPEDMAKAMAAQLGGDRASADTFYVVALSCGLLVWLMTAEFLVRSSNTIIESGSLVKKVAFPAELLPVSLLLSYAFNLVVVFAVFCAVTWTLTPFRSDLVWLFPIILSLHCLYLLGLGYIFTTINVFVRDVNQLVPIAVSLWFFLTPIVYHRQMASANKVAWLFDWNPMAYAVEVYRWALIYPASLRGLEGVDAAVIWRYVGVFGGIAIATFVAGYLFFMANKHKFADEI